MVKLKELLNENKGDLKEVKEQIKHLEEYLESYEEGLNKYKKWLKLYTKKPENLRVKDAKSLLKRHKELVVSQFNRQTYFTIENLIEEVKKVRDD